MTPEQLLADAPGEKAADGVDFKDVLGILARRKRTILLIPALLCALVIGYIAVAHPAYTAIAQVFVDPRDQNTPKDDPLQSSVPGDGLLLVESQLKIITSDEVLNRVIEQAGLQNDAEFNGQRYSIVSWTKELLGLGKTDDRRLIALRNLRLKTAAKRIDRSFVIDIMVSADTRERATMLANTVATAYLEEQAGANASFNRRMSEAIVPQLEKLRLEVKRGEEAVAAYKAANNLIGARTRLVTEQQLDEANSQLTSAKARLTEAQARVKLVETVERGGAGLDALPEAIQSGAIVQLRTRAADASREEAQLAQIDGPNHPALQAARAQLRDAQLAIKNELKLVAQAVRNAEASERTNVQNLQANFDTLKALSQTNDKAIVPLRELERKAESSRVIYETFLAKAKTADERQAIDTTNIRLISRATLPEHKSWPPTLIMLFVALFGGLTLGVALALAGDYFGAPAPAGSGKRQVPNKPATPNEIPVRPAAARPVVLTPEHQFSQLRADLLAAPAGHTIVLVRAQDDESLGLVALELARAMIAGGKDVLVIDADIARHRVTSRLGFGSCRGLRDVLAGKSSIREVTRLHRMTTMNVVPVGLAAIAQPGAGEKNALSAALGQARDFDRVIVDGGELGAAPPQLGLYFMADEVVFLASGSSSKSEDASILAEVLRHRQIKARVVFIEPDISVAA
jgi:uncharacterized protein involved in exopolysaccharide biosynthesis/Mrp family chromosome partitioning ATPase